MYTFIYDKAKSLRLTQNTRLLQNSLGLAIRKSRVAVVEQTKAPLSKAVTYHERPFFKRNAWVKVVFPREKDSFHSGSSLQKGAFIIGYGFSRIFFTGCCSGSNSVSTKVHYHYSENLKIMAYNKPANSKSTHFDFCTCILNVYEKDHSYVNEYKIDFSSKDLL